MEMVGVRGCLTFFLENEGTEPPAPLSRETCLVKAAPLRPCSHFSSIQDHNQYPLAVNSLSIHGWNGEEKKKKRTLFLIHSSRTAVAGILIKKSGKHSQQTLLSFSLLRRELRHCHRSNISMKSSLIISTRVCPASKPHYLKRKKRAGISMNNGDM